MMILRSIELDSFGKFRGRTVELRRGMNLVLGQNEAGKSTLAEVIPAVLFGSRHVERFKPWGRNACSAKLVFEGNNRTIVIQRDLLSDEVQLVERDDMYHTLAEFSGRVPPRGRSAIYQKYYDLLEELLGVSDEALFRATCFFGHRPQEWSGDDLSQKLRTLLGGGGAEGDYARLMDQLLEEHFAITRVSPWGRDKQRNRDYEDLCEQLARLEDRLPADGDALESAGAQQLQVRINALTEELEKDRDEYARGVRYVDQVRVRLKEKRELPDEEAAATAKSTPRATDANLQGVFREAGLPERLPPDLPDVLAEAAEIRQKLAEFQRPFSRLLQQEKKVVKVPWRLLAALSTLPLAAVIVAWWQELQPEVITGVASGALACFWGWGGWRHLQRKKALAECKASRSRLEQQKAVVLQRQAELTERCEALGLPSSAVDLVRIQKLIDKHRDQLETTGQETPAAEKTASPAVGERTAAQEVDAALTPEEEELADLEQRLADFADSLQRRERELQQLTNQHSAPELPVPDDDPLAAEVVALRQRKAEMEHQIAVLRTAIELLAEAIDEFARSDLSLLTEEVSKLFKKVTRGRYDKVRLDADMRPEVQIDGRRWRPIDDFSRGTVDALYLALRVALARVRGDGRVLPLLLDDPFAHLDQKRLLTVLNMLDLAAADGQLILLSHNEYLGRRAAKERWHVIALDEDVAEAEMEEEEQDHAGQLHLL